jgi:hypothetical protein
MNAIIANRLNFTRRLNTSAGIFDTQRPQAMDYQAVTVLKQQHCLALIPLYWMSEKHITPSSTGATRYEEAYTETLSILVGEFVRWADQYTNRDATLEIFDSMEEFHDAYGKQGFDFVKFWRPDFTSKALQSCDCGSCEYALFHLKMEWNLQETDMDQIIKAVNMEGLADVGISAIGEENARMRMKRVVSKLLLTTYSYPVWCLWRTRLCIRVGEVLPEEDAPMFLNADRCICCAYSFLPSDARYTAEKFCKNGTEVCASCYESRIVPTTSKKSSKWDGNVCLTGNYDTPEVKAMLQVMLESVRVFWDTLFAPYTDDLQKLERFFGIRFKNPIPLDTDKIMRKGGMIDPSKLFYCDWKGQWMDELNLTKSENLRDTFITIWERCFALGQGCWDVMYSKCIQRVGEQRDMSGPKTPDVFKELFLDQIHPCLCLLFLKMNDAIDARAEVVKIAEAQLLAEGVKKEKKVQEKTDKQLQAEATRLANQVQKQKKKDAEAFAEKAEKAEAKRKADQADKAKRIAKAKRLNALKCAGLL